MYRMNPALGWALLALAAIAGLFGVVHGWPLTLPAVGVLFVPGYAIVTDHRPARPRARRTFAP